MMVSRARTEETTSELQDVFNRLVEPSIISLLPCICIPAATAHCIYSEYYMSLNLSPNYWQSVNEVPLAMALAPVLTPNSSHGPGTWLDITAHGWT